MIEWQWYMWRGLVLGFSAACIFGFSLPGAQPPSVRWSFDATNGVQSSPAVGPDGTIYFGASVTDLYAVTPSGAMKWRYRTNQSSTQFGCLAPAVGADGTIYAGFSSVLLALSPDGAPQWMYPTTNFAYIQGRGPALGEDGSIFVAPASSVIKLAPGGALLWRADNGNSQAGWPVLTGAGVVKYGSYHNSFRAYSADGVHLWGTSHPHMFNFDAALDFQGNMYGSVFMALLSLDAIGRTNWIFSCKGHPRGSPAIDGSGDVYFGTDQGWFYAIEPDGTLKWSRQFGTRLNCSPAITHEGTIYFGDLTGQFFSLHPDGTTNWVLNIGPGAIESSPAIADDGTIYVGCGRRLVAIAAQSPPAASAWPMYRHDSRHTARQSKLSLDRPILTTKRRAGGTLDISLAANDIAACTLLSSSNLQTWVAYTNVPGPTNKHTFQVQSSRDQRFFRALIH